MPLLISRLDVEITKKKRNQQQVALPSSHPGHPKAGYLGNDHFLVSRVFKT